MGVRSRSRAGGLVHGCGDPALDVRDVTSGQYTTGYIHYPTYFAGAEAFRVVVEAVFGPHHDLSVYRLFSALLMFLGVVACGVFAYVLGVRKLGLIAAVGSRRCDEHHGHGRDAHPELHGHPLGGPRRRDRHPMDPAGQGIRLAVPRRRIRLGHRRDQQSGGRRIPRRDPHRVVRPPTRLGRRGRLEAAPLAVRGARAHHRRARDRLGPLHQRDRDGGQCGGLRSVPDRGMVDHRRRGAPGTLRLPLALDRSSVGMPSGPDHLSRMLRASRPESRCGSPSS